MVVYNELVAVTAGAGLLGAVAVVGALLGRRRSGARAVRLDELPHARRDVREHRARHQLPVVSQVS